MPAAPRRNSRFEHTRLRDPRTGQPATCTVTDVTGDRVRYRNDTDGATYSKPAAAFSRVVARWITDTQEPPT